MKILIVLLTCVFGFFAQAQCGDGEYWCAKRPDGGSSIHNGSGCQDCVKMQNPNILMNDTQTNFTPGTGNGNGNGNGKPGNGNADFAN